MQLQVEIMIIITRPADGSGGSQQSHDFRGYCVEPGRLHDGCMIRPVNHDHAWVFVGFDQFNTERIAGSDNLTTG
jgi:hypothetical protein